MKQEVFNIEKAINRLQWRFKNQNVKVNESKIIINELDIKAVDFLTEWINQQKKESLAENEMFAKLFCYAFKNELIFYKGDPKQSLRKICEQLELTVNYHYDEIHSTLNSLELFKYSEEIGMINKHPVLRTEEENNKNKEILKKDENFMNKIKGTWSIESVYKSLNNSITEIINKYR